MARTMAVVTCNDKKKLCGKYRCKFQDLTLTAIDPSDPQSLQKYTRLHNAKRRFAQRCVLWNRSTPVYRGKKTHTHTHTANTSAPKERPQKKLLESVFKPSQSRLLSIEARTLTSHPSTTLIKSRTTLRPKTPLTAKTCASVSAFIKQKQAQETFSHQGLPPPTIMQHKPLAFFNRKCNHNVTNLEE
jgi:hypothetical protein